MNLKFFWFDNDDSFNFRNGVNVEGANHRQVVELIKAGGDRYNLKLLES